ncbi:MAG: hypothetical protein ACE5EY_01285 [Anaerolineae bacterium]
MESSPRLDWFVTEFMHGTRSALPTAVPHAPDGRAFKADKLPG